MPGLTESEASVLYDAGKEAVVAFLMDMSRRIVALEERLALNSNNSSKPPSSDGFSKPALKPMPQSLRKKSGKRPGGQSGHVGKTLESVEKADSLVLHHPTTCRHCAMAFPADTSSDVYLRRQVFDVPKPRIIVTEHRAFTRVCTCCGHSTTASFPGGVEQPTQYGPNLLGLAVYLHGVHLVPFARTATIVRELTGALFTQGSLQRALKTAHERLTPFENDLREALAQVGLKHVDETGTRVSGKLQWFHVRCTEAMCWLFRHKQRGGKAAADLQNYSGTLVSDFWPSYVPLGCEHVFCGAHLLRELTFVAQVMKQEWAKSLIDELETAVDGCHAARERGSAKLWDAREFGRRMDECVEAGLRANPPPPKGIDKSKACRLAERLRDYKDDYQRFLFDLSLPFTNNEAERGLRMFKVKGKISGGFRTEAGADQYCRLRSYIATTQKQGMNVLECIRSIFTGEIIMPLLNAA
jgi:transposase